MDIPDSTPVEGFRSQSYEFIELIANKFPTTLCLIALAVGILIIYVGYRYSGGIYNKKELSFSIFISALIGALTTPLLFKGAIYLHVQNNKLILGFVYIIEVIFVAAVSAHTYEMVTVTAREAQARLLRD